ncbi:hypothetical protein ACOJQI_20345 [Bacillus salacetis]|uniref:hypothetical protein n=1 Tax=Bacillus salacetis TaxID=2315464 RepID=UPI003B9EB00A
MKKWLFLAIVGVILAGCSNGNSDQVSNEPSTEETSNDENETKTQEENTQQSSQEDTVSEKDEEDEAKEDGQAASETEDKKKSDPNAGLKKYRPEVGMKNIFTDGTAEIFSETAVAENDQFIQVVRDLNGNRTVSVYEWTADELVLVYQDTESEDPFAPIVENFGSNEEEQIIGSNEEVWKLIEDSATVTTELGEFTNVKVVQKTTNEVEGAETIFTRYYAPEYGLVKEVFELTGEQGYSGEAVLAKSEKR